MSALPNGTCVVALRAALDRLDLLLHRAISAAKGEDTSHACHPYRGLCVTDEEVEQLLVREPMGPSLCYASGNEAPRWKVSGETTIPLRHLDLSDFELDVVLIALAPELDLKYERLFAYLNDDLTRKWPTTDLALNILCSSSAERLAMYRHFSAGSRLFTLGVLQSSAPGEDDDTLLSRRLKLDPIVVRFLCGGKELDERLKRFCNRIVPSWSLPDVPVKEESVALLHDAAAHARAGERVRVQLRGPDGCGQQECAEAIASALEAELLIADLSRIPEQERHSPVRRVLLQARLFGQVPFLKGTAWNADGRTCDLLSTYPGPVLFDGFSGAHDDTAYALTMDLDRPGCEQRRTYWDRMLGDRALASAVTDRDRLAALFELSFSQIRAAVSDLQQATRVTGRAPTAEALTESARKHSSCELADKAELIDASRGWRDLILPDDATAQLHELCDRIRRRRRVLEQWGFARERRGIGVNALFVGTSGTGKTLAAEVVAADLGLNLYRIDLATVVSKYVGETEKNLESIFRGAEQSNAVLLFDEADALFGKRSAVRDAHDRYANVEIAYLLQRLESYPGVVILTTNLSDNLDQSFARRLAYTVNFPFPGPIERQRIWEAVWPPQAPLAPDFQPTWLAERFKLSGGNIRNVALAAASLVDNEAGTITMRHVLHALRREYHKMGKALAESELSRPAAGIRMSAS